MYHFTHTPLLQSEYDKFNQVLIRNKSLIPCVSPSDDYEYYLCKGKFHDELDGFYNILVKYNGIVVGWLYANCDEFTKYTLLEIAKILNDKEIVEKEDCETELSENFQRCIPLFLGCMSYKYYEIFNQVLIIDKSIIHPNIKFDEQVEFYICQGKFDEYGGECFNILVKHSGVAVQWLNSSCNKLVDEKLKELYNKNIPKVIV